MFLEYDNFYDFPLPPNVTLTPLCCAPNPNVDSMSFDLIALTVYYLCGIRNILDKHILPFTNNYQVG